MTADAAIFDPQDPKYLCGCGFHVTTGTYIVSLIDILTTLAYAILLYPGRRVMVIILVSIFIPIFLTPFAAVKKNQPKWLFPYLGLCALGLGYQLFAIVRFIYDRFFGYVFMGDDKVLSLAFMELGIDAVSFVIAYRCYQYLCELQKANNRAHSLSNV